LKTKALEVRDRATFIAMLCIDMNPENTATVHKYDAQRWLLRRCGYQCDGEPNIIMTRLDGNGQATNDPYAWKDNRTRQVAHDYIIKNWLHLKDGDVVDVEFILDETSEPKKSERLL
jgi:hypothetical protein